MNAHQFTFKTLDGQSLSLSRYAGKKILLVNTASACGLTPQYAQLQELHEQFQDKIAIVGLPCNDFAGQEPGTEHEIKSFCETKFGITFPLTEKVNIKSSPIHPLYEWLTSKEQNGHSDSEVSWNFQKYLIDEQGELQAVFSPRTEVLSDEVLSAIGISL